MALAQIKRIVRTIGEKRALELVGQAQAIEATGGQELPDGSRKRTKGGVFFRLVREQTSPEERQQIWFFPRKRAKAAGGEKGEDQPSASAPELSASPPQ